MGHNAILVALTSLFGKVLGFAKELLVAASFGLSGSLDIYLMAFVLIGFPLNILLNAVQTALISKLAAENNSLVIGRRLYTATAFLTLVCLALLLPIWLLLLPNALPWLTSGFSAEKRQGLELALLWLTPYYFLNGTNLLSYGVLQARGHYLINGLLPSITPITTIFILLYQGVTNDWHILTYALNAGALVECVLLLVVLYRNKQLALPSLTNTPGLKSVVGATLALLPGTIMIAIGPVISQAIAASVGEGTNAALGYGFKLPAALQGLFLTAIGITALPYFASQRGKNRAAYCLHSLDKLTGWLLVSGILLTIPLALFSAEIVALLYQRGAFDLEANNRVAPIQFAYFVQFPFALVAMLGVKVLAALDRNRIMSFYAITAVLLQSAFTYKLGIHYGAVGIAWAATIISALLAPAYYFTARSTLLRLIP
jgi:putative peptidoglycan lipid II flippase